MNYKSEIYKYDRIYNKGTDLEIKFFENLKLNYLQIPLLLKYYYLNQTDIYFGPSINFLLGGEYDHRWENVFDSGWDDYFNYNIKFNRDSKIPSYSIIFGTSYSWRTVIFDVRYYYDLTDIVDEDKGFPNNVIKKFNGFQITIGSYL